MAINRAISKEEKLWRAQSDARMLMESQAILQDKARLRAAQAEAAKVAKTASQAASTGKRRSK